MQSQAVECKTILLIEDDNSVRKMVSTLLEIEGFKVSTASNGREGLERMRAMQKPCVILLDMMMPVMNGWEFLEVQRSEAAFADIPVVVVSAFLESARSVKPHDVIEKPVQLHSLLSTVEKYCA